MKGPPIHYSALGKMSLCGRDLLDRQTLLPRLLATDEIVFCTCNACHKSYKARAKLIQATKENS